MTKAWVEPDIRDEIVETILEYKKRTGIPVNRLLKYLGLKESKYYEWRRRYGIPNRHNGKIPKAFGERHGYLGMRSSQLLSMQ